MGAGRPPRDAIGEGITVRLTLRARGGGRGRREMGLSIGAQLAESAERPRARVGREVVGGGGG